MPELVEELLEIVAEDAVHFGSESRIARIRSIAAEGSSADRQRAVHRAAIDGGADEAGAMRAVVAHLADAFADGR